METIKDRSGFFLAILLSVLVFLLPNCQQETNSPSSLCVNEGENVFQGAEDGDLSYQWELMTYELPENPAQFNTLTGVRFDDQNAAWFAWRWLPGRGAHHVSPAFVIDGDTTYLQADPGVWSLVLPDSSTVTQIDVLPAAQSVLFQFSAHGQTLEHTEYFGAVVSEPVEEIHPHFGPLPAPDTICITRTAVEQ